MSFSRTNYQGVSFWEGLPDCQAAHNYLLTQLQQMGVSFKPWGASLSDRCKGNLGEFIAMCIGRDIEFTNLQLFSANAMDPLSDISQPDIDLVWLFFAQNPAQDFAILQEIKTTGNPSLGYGNTLITDYNKLFGKNPAFTLQSRLSVIANRFLLEQNNPALAIRAINLAGINAQTCPGIRLYPTLVHEKRNADPVTKLTSVRSSIVSDQGWPEDSVQGWSVALEDLNDRLQRLFSGQA